MARKRRAVECVSYLDEDPYEEADERSLVIDLNADSDKGASKQRGLNKNKQNGCCLSYIWPQSSSVPRGL